MAIQEIKSIASIRFPVMVGETVKPFDFVSGGSELALTVHWLGTKQKFFARLADDDGAFWSGYLNVDDPVIAKGALADTHYPDIIISVVPYEQNPSALKPSTIASDYGFFVAVTRGF